MVFVSIFITNAMLSVSVTSSQQCADVNYRKINITAYNQAIYLHAQSNWHFPSVYPFK